MGTADTEALTGFLAGQDPRYFSSYAAALSDRPAWAKAKPRALQLLLRSSYSDAVRRHADWATEDWKAKGKTRQPKFVHWAEPSLSDAPRSGEAIAAELGFELLPPIVFALTPGDYSAHA